MGDVAIQFTRAHQSRLRIVAGSDDVVIYSVAPMPNRVVRWLTRVLLRMEWLPCA